MLPTQPQASGAVPDLQDWPVHGLVEDLLPTLARWHARGRRVALATLVRVFGSAPRPVGSEMLIAEDGAMAGYVSGGCVEAAVAQEALACLADGRARLLDYGAGSQVMDLQLSCGGRIHVLVRPLVAPGEYLARLTQARRERRHLVAISHLTSGALRWAEDVGTCGAEEFARLHAPPLRLVLVGGDPVTLALIALGARIGLEVVLIRPHGPPVPPPGLARTHYDARALPQALAAMPVDARTAVYSLAHEEAVDLTVLAWALRSPAFCVGALGSRSKIPGRLAALRAAGLDEMAMGRLHLPAGLDLGGDAPMEIALAILAQVQARRPRP